MAYLGSRMVDYLIPRIDYLVFQSRPAKSYSIFKDFMALTKINRTGTIFASFIGGIGFAAGFAPAVIPVLLYGLVTIVLMYVSIAILNDVIDAEADKVNDPERPLARGALSIDIALGLSGLIFSVGALAAFHFSWMFGVFYLIEFGMGILYCYWAKRNGLFSYMLLGCTHIAFPFMAGGILIGTLSGEIILVAAYVFLTMFLGIVIKDFKDIEGDRITGVKTFPIIYGTKKAYIITAFGFLLAPLTFLVPWLFLGLSIWFLALYSIVAIWKIVNVRKLLRFPEPSSAVRTLNQFRFAVIGEMLAWGLATA